MRVAGLLLIFWCLGLIPLRAADADKYILTPKPGAAPKLNGPPVYGARPGRPFLYRIPCTGRRPIQFSAKGLPASLRLDAATGIIGGRAPEKRGEYVVTLQARNSQGAATRRFKIVVGDTLALTPPMGWNDWYTHYDRITDKLLRQAADAMISSGMADYGYQYVNIDDCWMVKPGSKDPALGGEPRDAAGAICSNGRFPDMQALTELHPRQRPEGWHLHFARPADLRGGSRGRTSTRSSTLASSPSGVSIS